MTNPRVCYQQGETRNDRKSKTEGGVRMDRLSTNPGVLPVGRVLRDPTIPQASLVTPIIRLLRLPRPLDPPSALLVRDGLRLPILPKERLVALAEVRSRACLGRTASNPRRTDVRSIVTCTNSASVEILGAIGRSRCPFTHNHPKMEGRESTSL